MISVRLILVIQGKLLIIDSDNCQYESVLYAMCKAGKYLIRAPRQEIEWLVKWSTELDGWSCESELDTVHWYLTRV